MKMWNCFKWQRGRRCADFARCRECARINSCLIWLCVFEIQYFVMRQKLRINFLSIYARCRFFLHFSQPKNCLSKCNVSPENIRLHILCDDFVICITPVIKMIRLRGRNANEFWNGIEKATRRTILTTGTRRKKKEDEHHAVETTGTNTFRTQRRLWNSRGYQKHSFPSHDKRTIPKFMRRKCSCSFRTLARTNSTVVSAIVTILAGQFCRHLATAMCTARKVYAKIVFGSFSLRDSL